MNNRLYCNTKYSPDQSIALRYHRENPLGFSEAELAAGCIREGVRIRSAIRYKDCSIHVMDETTLMHSHTFHSLDGALINSLCHKHNYEMVVIPTGGNLGIALAHYCGQCGIHVFIFTPEHCVGNFSASLISNTFVHLIAVSDGKNKSAAIAFAQFLKERMTLAYNPFVMRKEYRQAASIPRGCFIHEHMQTNHSSFDWIAQTISAAFGPLGIYEALNKFRHQNSLTAMPRFLAVQQATNAPMFNKIKGEQLPFDINLLLPNLYDSTPETYGTLDQLRALLKDSNGDICTIDHDEFDDFLQRDWDGKSLLRRLRDLDINITLDGQRIQEKTGLLSLMGVLKSIDAGIIHAGEHILVCLTGGAKPLIQPTDPHLWVRGDDYWPSLFEVYLKSLKL